MEQLVLFRHAQSEPRSSGGGDIERRLTAAGRADAAAMGALIATRGLAPDLTLVSTALRARETWACASSALRASRCEFRAALYNADARTLAAQIDDLGQAPHILMLIGHNPGLQELALDLLAAGGASPSDVEQVSMRFAPATVAVLGIDEAGRASLQGVFHADERVGGAR
ncbi:MAG: SixA phosphatase family protein [Caulobacteraceae bacterium]